MPINRILELTQLVLVSSSSMKSSNGLAKDCKSQVHATQFPRYPQVKVQTQKWGCCSGEEGAVARLPSLLP